MTRRLALALPLAAAACVGPPPKRAPVMVARPAPTIVAPPPIADWRDVPLSAGRWTYARETGAAFGREGAPPDVVLRCAAATHRVQLVRAGMAAGMMTVTTSYGASRWPAVADGRGGAVAELAAADPALDRIAFSRGRFTIEAAGSPTLILPAWAEPARVIEDCRG